VMPAISSDCKQQYFIHWHINTVLNLPAPQKAININSTNTQGVSLLWHGPLKHCGSIQITFPLAANTVKENCAHVS
ncbi:Uncharacterized protein DAT39_005404, partial [Clarias magur]